ncbi:MAG: apolipoprotein N-acyltransferase [Elusimicrobia bacterium]|nr:apolipoprotein N-acyltransferase [Elusimicrobiota bacterium]
MKRHIPLWVGPLATAVLYVFCFPRFNAGGWLGWVVLVPFLLAIPRWPLKKALIAGGLAGFGAHLGTLYWVYPTCRWGGVGIGVSALALVSLSAYLALYWSAFAAAVKAGEEMKTARPFFLAAAWVALEYLRAHLLTGFPWLPLAGSQWLVPKHLPLAAIGGAHAVSFMVALFNGALALAIDGRLRGEKRWARPAVPALLALVGLTAWSVALWRHPPAEGPALRAAIVQGNIDQYKKWDQNYEDEIVAAYTALTRTAAQESPALIVWPETAVPGWIPNDVKYLEWVAGLAKAARIPILFGAVSRQAGRDYNAAFLMSPAGELIGQYRKRHLVPFGEYAPFQKILGRLDGVLSALGAFDAGDEASVLAGPVPLGVSVCFEGLFPGLVADFSRAGAKVLVNITNDGWYRDNAAPEQHFSANVLRAVENGRWVLRAANTGISGFINPRGEILAKTALLTAAVLPGPLTATDRPTFYVRHGDWFAGGCCLIVLLGAGKALIQKRRRPFPAASR